MAKVQVYIELGLIGHQRPGVRGDGEQPQHQPDPRAAAALGHPEFRPHGLRDKGGWRPPEDDDRAGDPEEQ